MRLKRGSLRWSTPSAENILGACLIRVLLWLPILLAAGPTGLLWRFDRRPIVPGHRRKCGYNLTGNASGICPECGQPIQYVR